MILRYNQVSQTKLILAVATFLAIFHNFTFLQQVVETYSATNGLWVKVFSVSLVHGCLLVIILSSVGISRLLKPSIILLLLASSLTAYFIDTYRVVIDSNMVTSFMETDGAEAFDLLGYRMLGYFLILGVAPSYLVYRTRLRAEPPHYAVTKRTGLILACLVIAGATIYISSDFYASFFRAHKIVRYYTNPITPLYSLFRFANNKLDENAPREFVHLGTDAVVPESDVHKELVVLVIGETARSDHFHLNGYDRDTNPLLAREDIVSFTNVHSCGTSTSVSLPCMFSYLDRKGFSQDTSSSMDNVLDVLNRTGVQILWRDNNSGSKGVADRVEYQDFRNPEVNPVCNPECRDEGMLANLDDWIALHQNRDILIVLHQMGSHGPAYFKRYPPEFEAFKPTCHSNQLEDCTHKAVVNSYDNTILYTDYFLSRVIAWLKNKSQSYETSMMYVSDHGESLGETGIYLHGLPYLLAPDAQTHVPAILWASDQNWSIDLNAVRNHSTETFSHDNLFHTLLGLFEVRSAIYEQEKDILRYAHRHHEHIASATNSTRDLRGSADVATKRQPLDRQPDGQARNSPDPGKHT